MVPKFQAIVIREGELGEGRVHRVILTPPGAVRQEMVDWHCQRGNFHAQWVTPDFAQTEGTVEKILLDLIPEEVEVTYEVLGYEDTTAFVAGRFVVVGDGFEYQQDAVDRGQEALQLEYPLVKVQSSDREFIQIFARKGFDGEFPQ